MIFLLVIELMISSKFAVLMSRFFRNSIFATKQTFLPGLEPRPGPFVAQAGKDLTIPCVYVGDPAASSITWKQGETEIVSTSSAQQLDLSLNSVTKQQNGEYTCVVLVGDQVIERVIELNVLCEYGISIVMVTTNKL